MKKENIGSLTRKGWTQDKIARALHIRKSKVVKYQQAHEIGKRSEWGEHVKAFMTAKEISYKEAIEEVKKTPYWARKRLARMSKAEKKKIKVPGYWQKPIRPKEALKGSFIDVEGVEYYA